MNVLEPRLSLIIQCDCTEEFLKENWTHILTPSFSIKKKRSIPVYIPTELTPPKAVVSE